MNIKSLLNIFLILSGIIYSAVSSAEQSQTMAINIIAFEDERPLEYAYIKIGSQSCKTDGYGRCFLEIEKDKDQSEELTEDRESKLPLGYYIYASNDESTAFSTFEFKPFGTTLVIIRFEENTTEFKFDYPEQPKAEVAQNLEGQENTDTAKEASYSLTVQGTVTKKENGDAIKDAQLFVLGSKSTATTDSDGKYKIDVPVGSKITVIHPKFSNFTSGEITGKEKETVTLDISLSPAAIELKEFVVTAPHIKGSISSLLDEKKATKEVADVIGSEQMSKSGDSDAASALGRVTGLTIVDDKYIFVRGLDERYTAVLLNGAKLPSLDPSKRVIPLDIIPTGIIESIKVQKTLIPSNTAEFGGGIISIRTKSYPEKFKARIGFSLGLEQYSSDGIGAILPTIRFDDVNTYKGGKTDYLGLDDGTRKLPDNVNQASTYKGKINDTNYTPEEIKGYTKSFKDIWNTKESEKLGPMSLGFDLGDSYRVGDIEFGFNTSLLYGDKYDRGSRELYRYVASDGKLDSIDKELTYDISKRTVKMSALLGTGIEFSKNNKISTTSILSRKSTDEILLKEGSSGSGDDKFEATKLEWEERKLESNQIAGKHKFKKIIGLDWRYSKSSAERYSPDTREYIYDVNEDGTSKRLSTRSNGATRTYAKLTDSVENYGVDFTFDAYTSKSFETSVKLGLDHFTKDRQSDQKRYFYKYSDSSAIDLSQDVESILSVQNIDGDIVTVEEGTLNTDEYTAKQLLDSYYYAFDFTIIEDLILNIGQRYEWSNQQVLTYDKDAASKIPVKTELDDKDTFNAINATYRLIKEFQVRAAYSETIARPEFRELSNATFFDDSVDLNVQGYPDLSSSRIFNTDVRLEYYPTFNESISLGLFDKQIEDPIEKYYITEGADSQVITFRNSEKASNQGYEIEWLLKPGIMPQAMGLTFGGNYSRVFSKTTIDPSKIAGASSVTSLERPMQGVSPYSFNSFLSFEWYRQAVIATLLYNEVGERITEIGTNGVPDIWQDTLRSIDFIATMKFGRERNWEVGLKAKNIYPTDVITRQDGKIITKEEGESEISAGMRYSF